MGERLDNIRENPKEFLKDVGMTLVVVLVSLSYIVSQLVGLESVSFENPWVLLAGAILSIFTGVSIKQALGEKGFTIGYKAKDWLEAKAKYDNACNAAIPYMEKEEVFYDYEEIEIRRDYRRDVLMSKRMKYEMWFDGEGNYIGTKEMVKKLTIWQKLALWDAIRVRVHINRMFSENSRSARNRVKKAPTDATQRAKSGFSNTLSAVLISCLNVAFNVYFKTFTIAGLIFALIQVALWLIFGFVNMFKNYNFVTKIKPSILADKKSRISKFIAGCEQHLYDHKPYEVYQEKPMIGVN